MDLKDTLVAFGEWLDEENICYVGPHPDMQSEELTHEDLAKEFIEQWKARPGTATLAGLDYAVTGERVDKVNRHSADALGLAPVEERPFGLDTGS